MGKDLGFTQGPFLPLGEALIRTPADGGLVLRDTSARIKLGLSPLT
jgi:hypothetical protein